MLEPHFARGVHASLAAHTRRLRCDGVPRACRAKESFGFVPLSEADAKVQGFVRAQAFVPWSDGVQLMRCGLGDRVPETEEAAKAVLGMLARAHHLRSPGRPHAQQVPKRGQPSAGDRTGAVAQANDAEVHAAGKRARVARPASSSAAVQDEPELNKVTLKMKQPPEEKDEASTAAPRPKGRQRKAPVAERGAAEPRAASAAQKVQHATAGGSRKRAAAQAVEPRRANKKAKTEEQAPAAENETADWVNCKVQCDECRSWRDFTAHPLLKADAEGRWTCADAPDSHPEKKTWKCKTVSQLGSSARRPPAPSAALVSVLRVMWCCPCQLPERCAMCTHKDCFSSGALVKKEWCDASVDGARRPLCNECERIVDEKDFCPVCRRLAPHDPATRRRKCRPRLASDRASARNMPCVRDSCSLADLLAYVAACGRQRRRRDEADDPVRRVQRLGPLAM